MYPAALIQYPSQVSHIKPAKRADMTHFNVINDISLQWMNATIMCTMDMNFQIQANSASCVSSSMQSTEIDIASNLMRLLYITLNFQSARNQNLMNLPNQMVFPSNSILPWKLRKIQNYNVVIVSSNNEHFASLLIEPLHRIITLQYR